MSVTAATKHQPQPTWANFRQGVAKLVEAPKQALATGLRQLTRLPAVATMKARAAAHELNGQWQAVARRPAPRPDAKASFLAENREALRTGRSWARQDRTGSWQLPRTLETISITEKEADALEEAQASIRAARFADGLTGTERYTLLRDGVVRLRGAGFKVGQVKDLLWIQEK